MFKCIRVITGIIQQSIVIFMFSHNIIVGSQVFSFPVFTPRFCMDFIEEIVQFEESDMPKGRPNTMNNFGVFLFLHCNKDCIYMYGKIYPPCYFYNFLNLFAPPTFMVMEHLDGSISICLLAQICDNLI